MESFKFSGVLNEFSVKMRHFLVILQAINCVMCIPQVSSTYYLKPTASYGINQSGITSTTSSISSDIQSAGAQLTSPPSPPPQTAALSGLVKSGPVVLVNKTTLYIPDLHYNGDFADAHFWVGKGLLPNSSGVAIPDETNSLGNLHAYNGDSIYLNLPQGLGTTEIKHLAVWDRATGRSLAHVPIFDERVPLSSTSAPFVLLVPKCCAIGSVLTTKGCKPSPVTFAPTYKVFQHNNTHLDNTPLTGVVFQPFLYELKCVSGKFALDEEREGIAFLRNGSLVVNGVMRKGLMSQGEYCVDGVLDEMGNYSMEVFVCAPEVRINHAMFHAYITLTIISTICFGAAFVVYYLILKCEDIHKHCFTAYSLSMFLTFICLDAVQILSIEDKGCEVIGFLFQIFMVSSFTWLAILCVDICLLVIYFDDNMKKGKRMMYYTLVGLGMPLLSLIVSVSRNLIPDVPNSFFKPQYGRNTCYFEAENQRIWYFYLPIICCISVSIISLGFTCRKTLQLDRTEQYNFSWLDNKQNYKFMMRRYFIVFIMMLLWMVEAIVNIKYATSSMIVTVDLLEATQGIFTLALFVLNRETKNKIDASIKKRKLKLNRKPNQEEVPLSSL